MTVKVGFVTIGQSPREDVVPEIMALLGPEYECLEKGAMDGLNGEEIKNLKPDEGDFRLITKLRDGRSAEVGRKKIIRLLRKKIDELASQDVRLIALLCTDEFPSIGHERGDDKIVLQPSLLLRRAAVGRLKKGKLGVFVPLPEQKEETKRKWKRTGWRVVVEAINPYQEAGEGEKAFQRMRNEKVDLIVLDCIGYSKETKDKLQCILDKPVLWPRAILAKAIIQPELFMK